MSELTELFDENGKIDKKKVENAIWSQMTRGAFVAFGIFFGAWAFVAVLAWLGTFLPPESKEAVDPTPDSFPVIEAPAE